MGVRFYAVPDPSDSGRMVYMRRNAKGQTEPWPANAQYGPQFPRTGSPADALERRAWREAWMRAVYRAWWVAVAQSIAADPVLAETRFAVWCSMCSFCGKLLTEESSKVYGIGPDCRRGLPDDYLADRVHRIGIAHAEHLASGRSGVMP